ncbi:CinA family protein [uncultured Amnibacterium sp.]|uniref:CinA family protein n=1 Tax=uncultured Amnibacterium sp. TaxID=1631851 RepID=UPI0035CC6BE2
MTPEGWAASTDGASVDRAAALLERLAADGRTLAVAESLTGGLLADAFVSVPGASRVLLGAVVAYATPVKHSLLGVDARLLAREGAVHPQVAEQMAEGVRAAVAVDGRSADVGLATTGVAGPDPQDGQPPGTVFVAAAVAGTVLVLSSRFEGDRDRVRHDAVALALDALTQALDRP